MHHIYNVFYVSLLNPYKLTSIPPHSLPLAPPPLYIKDNQEYFEIKNILNSRHMKNWLQYLVKWKGYPDSDNSWKPLGNIPAHGLIKEFHCWNPIKPISLQNSDDFIHLTFQPTSLATLIFIFSLISMFRLYSVSKFSLFSMLFTSILWFSLSQFSVSRLSL